MDNSIFEMLKRYVETFEVQDAEQLALKTEALELIRKKEELIDEEFQALKDAAENEDEECIGCDKMFDFELMEQDDAGENYCPECWKHFKPLLRAEYEELLRNGEIEE